VWEFRDFRSRVESVITACVLFKRERENIIMRSRYIYYLEKKKRREMREIETELIKNALDKKKTRNERAHLSGYASVAILLLLLLFVRENKDVCTD